MEFFLSVRETVRLLPRWDAMIASPSQWRNLVNAKPPLKLHVGGGTKDEQHPPRPPDPHKLHLGSSVAFCIWELNR
ncbi:hypothetical protein BHM03_00039234 [Ensete ventricosum]|nr:hypothetical protein BHM03_00039234 [Ensete ventricosum]